jgi:hypothetical protein
LNPSATWSSMIWLHFSTLPSGDVMYPDVDATAFEEHSNES